MKPAMADSSLQNDKENSTTNLPCNDSVCEIMARLTNWRDVCRYRCVSKDWNKFLNSPDFLKNSITINKSCGTKPEILAGFIHTVEIEYDTSTSSRYRRIEFSKKFLSIMDSNMITSSENELKEGGLMTLNRENLFNLIPWDSSIVECRHGLILFSSIVDNFTGDRAYYMYHILNPVIGKSIRLPLSAKTRKDRARRIGLFVDKTNGHYYVAEVYSKRVEAMPLVDSVTIKLYSSTDNLWSIYNFNFNRPPPNLYWASWVGHLGEIIDTFSWSTCNLSYTGNPPPVQIESSVYFIWDCLKLMHFDMNKKTMDTIMWPNYPHIGGPKCISQHNDKLRFCGMEHVHEKWINDHEYGYMFDKYEMCLWELGAGEDWKLLAKIELNSIEEAIFKYMPKNFSKNDIGRKMSFVGLEGELVYMVLERMIIAYNIFKNKVEMNMKIDHTVPAKGFPLPNEKVVLYRLPKIPLPL